MAEASNSSEKDKWVVGPGWHLIEEPRVRDKDGIGLSKATGIKRDSDGFTMISEAAGFMGEFEIFRCKRDDFPEFRFDASRRSLPENPPSDTYIVEIDGSDAPREIIYKYAKDIEAGLIAYPPTIMFDYMPVKHVKFDISIVGLGKPSLVTAEEIKS